MKTIAITAQTVNIAGVNYEENILINLHNGLADKLISDGLATDSAYGIDAAIKARTAYITNHWQTDPTKAEIEASVIRHPVIDVQTYAHNLNPGTIAFPLQSL